MSDKKIATDDLGYWKANIAIIKISFVIWAAVSFGFGILLRAMLSSIMVGGADLGFWFALIFSYA
ncbi:MAG: putative solute:sodium symporter small subunit [Paracoccaceae bacterium]|jgi:putative solute:sodium symporter small subunit